MKEKLERKLFAMGIVTILVLLLAFNKHSAKTVEANISELLSSNKIKLKCKSTNFHSGESVNVEMMNLSNTSYNVKFPKGTIFKSESGRKHNVLLLKDEFVTIESKSYIEIEIQNTQKIVE